MQEHVLTVNDLHHIPFAGGVWLRTARSGQRWSRMSRWVGSKRNTCANQPPSLLKTMTAIRDLSSSCLQLNALPPSFPVPQASQSWFQFDALRILGQKCEESGEELIEMEVDVRQVSRVVICLSPLSFRVSVCLLLSLSLKRLCLCCHFYFASRSL